MDQDIKAGISGLIIAVVINFLSPADLYFFPQLVASIIVIYVFGLRTIKDAFLAAFITYVFTDWILTSVVLVAFFFSGETTVTLTIDVWAVLTQIVTAPTALLAGLVGIWLAKTRQPTVTAPPPPQPIPPV